MAYAYREDDVILTPRDFEVLEYNELRLTNYVSTTDPKRRADINR